MIDRATYLIAQHRDDGEPDDGQDRHDADDDPTHVDQLLLRRAGLDEGSVDVEAEEARAGRGNGVNGAHGGREGSRDEQPHDPRRKHAHDQHRERVVRIGAGDAVTVQHTRDDPWVAHDEDGRDLEDGSE